MTQNWGKDKERESGKEAGQKPGRLKTGCGHISDGRVSGAAHTRQAGTARPRGEAQKPEVQEKQTGELLRTSGPGALIPQGGLLAGAMEGSDGESGHARRTCPRAGCFGNRQTLLIRRAPDLLSLWVCRA